MHNIFNICGRVAAAVQQGGQGLEVGDGFEVVGALFAAEGAVEVGADADVEAIASELADMVEVVDQHFEVAIHAPGIGLAAHPAGNHHPGIEGATDYRSTLNQSTDLVIAELAVVINERPAIVVARPNVAVEMIQRFPETIVAQMCCIQDDVQPLHFFQ